MKFSTNTAKIKEWEGKVTACYQDIYSNMKKIENLCYVIENAYNRETDLHLGWDVLGKEWSNKIKVHDDFFNNMIENLDLYLSNAQQGTMTQQQVVKGTEESISNNSL